MSAVAQSNTFDRKTPNYLSVFQARTDALVRIRKPCRSCRRTTATIRPTLSARHTATHTRRTDAVFATQHKAKHHEMGDQKGRHYNGRNIKSRT
jgi:hypothetical protein